jgi:hypothetical protein
MCRRCSEYFPWLVSLILVFSRFLCGIAFVRNPLLIRISILPLILVPIFSAEFESRNTESFVTARNAHESDRQVRKTVLESEKKESIRTNTVVELQNGKNRFDESLQQWVEANDAIELVEGAAVARGTGHRVIFSSNLNDKGGTVDLLTPDRKRLRSQPIGIAYTEKSSGKSVFIAEIVDSTGELHAENEVIYPKCFDSIDADVRYRHSLSGLEQDVIFREQLPRPEEFGFDSRETYLEVWTEFLEAPEPEKTPHLLTRHLDKSQDDETLNFGEMQIISGKAFDLGDEDQNTGIRVAKEWVSLNGMTFLIESIPVIDVAQKIESLPAREVAFLRKEITEGLKIELAKAEELSPKAARPKPISLKQYKAFASRSISSTFIAKTEIPTTARPGFLFDYTLVATAPAYTFESDKTYYISGAVTLSGTTTFEGGAVIKYNNTATSKITITGPIAMRTSMYRPVIMTAKDDNTVGEQVVAGSPSDYYANPALALNGANAVYNLSDFRILHARLGIQVDYNNSVGHTFRNFQLVNCHMGFKPVNCELKLLNGLMWNVATNFDAPYYSTNFLQNVTINTSTYLQRSPTVTLLNLNNCLLTAVNNQGTISGSPNINLASSDGVFQAVGGAGHYLAVNSPYRNAGTTAIDSGLLSDLGRRTTYPPVTLVSAVTTDTILRPQAIRDTDTPDIGYHYPPLDWIASGVAIGGAALTLTNGVAVGIYGETGFKLQTGSKITSGGTPLFQNRLVRYQAVQEVPSADWNTVSPSSLLKEDLTSGTLPEVRLRFTELALLANSGDHFSGGGKTALFTLQDCELTGGWFSCSAAGSSSRKFAFTNSLFERVNISVGNGADTTLASFARNNLFKRCATINLNAPAGNSWEWKDNAFDQSTIWMYYAQIPASGNNAYIGMVSRMSPTSTSDVVLGSFNYSSPSALGRYYQSSTSLQNVGSRGADAAGLFHYTARVGSVKEGSSVVDIGYHYMTLNNAVPFDSDGDGIADYLEDSNGNEFYDSSEGETNWEASENGTTLVPGLSVFTILE